ncbi:MAG: VCBS repeat-containing protein [Candidatus Altiarchaeota archaeon]
MRFTPVLSALLLLSLLASAQDWPMYQHDPAHSGSTKGVMDLNSTSPHVEWVYYSPYKIQYPPVAADINDDGKLEVVYTTLDGVVKALSFNGDEMWSYNAGNVISSPAAIGRWLSGKSFITFVTADGKLSVLDSNGDLKMAFNSLNNVYSTSISVVNIRGDESPEILFDSVAVNLDGIPRKYGEEELRVMGVALGFDVVADLEGMGNYRVYKGVYPEVPAISEVDGNPYIVRFGSNKSTRMPDVPGMGASQVNISPSIIVRSPPIAADLDRDGLREILFCSDDDTLDFLNVGSGKITVLGVAKPKCVGVIAADLNRDGLLEVVMAQPNGKISVFTTSNDYYPEAIKKAKIDAKTKDQGDTDEKENSTGKKDKSAIETAKRGFLILFVVILLFASFFIINLKIKPLPKEDSVKHQHKGRAIDKAWENLLLSEVKDIEPAIIDGLLTLTSNNPIHFDEAAERLKVSRVKLAQHAMKLSESGYIILDDSWDKSNPILKSTGKSRPPTEAFDKK